jgi:hypothetical protein
MSGDTFEHARADFFAIMKGEYIVGPTRAEEYAVRPFCFALDLPTDPKESREHLPRPARRPLCHALNAKSSSSSGIDSP